MTEVFPIVPAPLKVLWFFGGVSVLLVALLLFLAYVAMSGRLSRFEVSPEGLRLRGDLYGRLIPMDALRIAEAQILRLEKTSQFWPTRKTVGSNLPGYYSGWFKLRSGEKALLYVTDRRQVVYVPTTKGYSVMLSVREPQRLLEALGRQAAGG